MNILTRLFAKTNIKDQCWIWEGAKVGTRKHVYGVFDGTTAHRRAYELLVGPIPEGFVVDHKICENKLCINPFHTEPVTKQVNLNRSTKTINHKNSLLSHCKNGHKLSGDNVRIYRHQRVCRSCKREWAASKRKLKKEIP